MKHSQGDLAFAQMLIVELQHLVRGLRHELHNEKVASAELARTLNAISEGDGEVQK